MNNDKFELLNALEFGSVDSESEEDLDAKFIRTEDFNSFLKPRNALILGAKGSGKSALFQMFAKYEDSARKLANIRKADVMIVTVIILIIMVQGLQSLGNYLYKKLS